MTDLGKESKYLTVRVEGLLDNQMVTDLLMKKMVVKVVTKSGEVLEEATFLTQVTSIPPMQLRNDSTEKERVEM